MSTRRTFLHKLPLTLPSSITDTLPEKWPLQMLLENHASDRRGFLKTTLALTGATVVGGGLVLSTPQVGRANPLLWVARTAFASAIGWFVGRMLDNTVGVRLDNAGYRANSSPGPSGRNAFHDSYAARHLSNYDLGWLPSTAYNDVNVRLSGYLWATPNRNQYWFSDYGCLELVTLQDWNRIMIPLTYRVTVANPSWRRTEEILDAGLYNPRDYRPAYQRTFDDMESGRRRTIVAAARADNPQVGRLISFDA